MEIFEYSGHQADQTGVRRFARAMEEKLRKKRYEGRHGWNKKRQVTDEQLIVMLAEHVKKGDMVDIANFAMFIWNRQNPNG